MTDLPFGRGGSPLQNLIARGITKTKISALKCVKELDGGPVYLKKPLILDGTAEEILTRAYGIIEGMIVEILERNPAPVPQEGSPTLFRRRTPEEGRLDDCSSLPEFYDRVRMLDAEGYPHAFIDAGRFRIEFRKAALSGESVTAEVRVTTSPEPKTEGARHAK
jgi:methionyl-tRNA formyltransferase